MKNKILIILVFFIIVLIISLVGVLKIYDNVLTDRNRLKENQTTLMSDLVFYKTKDSLSVASVGRLQLSVDELNENRQNLLQVIDNLNLKVKRLNTASITASETKYKFISVFKDSIIYKTDTVRCVDFADEWLSFTGCEDNNGTFTAECSTIDTIYTIAHRVPRRFLFFKFGTKAIRQEVISKNPHSKIIYTEYIELKRNKCKQ